MAASTQKQAVTAALRTVEQTVYAGLGTIVAGGAILGATDIQHIDWEQVGAAVGFLLIVAVGAGLKSYLSFLMKGVPSAYTDAVDTAVTVAERSAQQALVSATGVSPAPSVAVPAPAAAAPAAPAVQEPAQAVQS